MFNNRLFQISAFVVAIHVLFVIGLYAGFYPQPIYVQPKRLAVQTIALMQPPSQAKTVAKPPPPPKAEIPKPSPSPTPKKPAEPPQKKPIVKKAPPPAAKPKPREPRVVKKEPSPKPIQEKKISPSPQEIANLEKKEKALQLVRENIAKIQAKGDKFNSDQLPQSVSLKKVEKLISDDVEQETPTHLEASYQEELAYFLKKKLHLVEIGDVKVKLIVKNTGELASFSIVYAESRLNRELIEKTLPGLQFPNWNKKLSNQNTYTCCVILSHND